MKKCFIVIFSIIALNPQCYADILVPENGAVADPVKVIQMANVTCEESKGIYSLNTYRIIDSASSIKEAIERQPEIKQLVERKDRVYVNNKSYSKEIAEHKCRILPKYSVVTSIDTTKDPKFKPLATAESKEWKGKIMISSPFVIKVYEDEKLLGTYLISNNQFSPRYTVSVNSSTVNICREKECNTYKLDKIRKKPFYFQPVSYAIE